MVTDKFINPFTDFGFKKLFGTEFNKPLLINFLNQLISNEAGEIKELTYLQNEHIGRSTYDRRAIFDLYCKNQEGEFMISVTKTLLSNN